MKLDWRTMETAPKDREILLVGSDEYGDEMAAFAKWEVEERYEWETIVATEDEQHKRRVLKQFGYWDAGKVEIFPILWAGVDNPMPRRPATP